MSRCMNMGSAWDGWSHLEGNETGTGLEDYILSDITTGEATEADLAAFRKLCRDTKGDEDGGMYAQMLFEYEYRGYARDAYGQLTPPQPGHGDR
jgi:hypothetical protein